MTDTRVYQLARQLRRTLELIAVPVSVLEMALELEHAIRTSYPYPNPSPEEIEANDVE